MNKADLNTFFQDFNGLPRTTALVRDKGIRTLLLHLKAGESMPEHQTPAAITVHCLKGEITFSSGPEQAQLAPGVLISLPASQPHAVAAVEDSLLLVTISEQVDAYASKVTA